MAHDNSGNRGNRLQRPQRLADFINYRVYHLNRVGLGAAALHLRARAGVTRREWRMISFLGEQPGTRLTELAESAGLDKVLASRAVHAWWNAAWSGAKRAPRTGALRPSR